MSVGRPISRTRGRAGLSLTAQASPLAKPEASPVGPAGLAIGDCSVHGPNRAIQSNNQNKRRDLFKMSRKEFIGMTACVMAISVLALDAMLPALPMIGADLHVAEENSRQWVITTFWIGLGVGNLLYLPFADRIGRRTLLLTCLAASVLGTILAGLAGSMAFLLTMRAVQGIAAAGLNFLAFAIVRDRYKGDENALIQSRISAVFLATPVLAPAAGQLLLIVATWRFLFIVLAPIGALLALWIYLRLPESLAREDRRPVAAAVLGEAMSRIFRTRVVIGNIVAATFGTAAFAAFIHSIEQIVSEVFQWHGWVGFTFIAFALPVAGAYRLNERLLPRHGARKILLWSLLAMMAVAALHLAVRLAWGENLWTFGALLIASLFWLGLINANSQALMLEPVGDIAGTVSAFREFMTNCIGGGIGLVIGQMFNLSTVPFVIGFAICALLALVAARWANPAPQLAPA